MKKSGRPTSLAAGNYLWSVITRLRLWWRLIRDPRVSQTLKLALLGLAAVYLLWPADIIPDVIPFVGQLDDVTALLLALKLFESFVPAAIVQEHLAALRRRPQPKAPADEDVIEGEYRVL